MYLLTYWGYKHYFLHVFIKGCICEVITYDGVGEAFYSSVFVLDLEMTKLKVHILAFPRTFKQITMSSSTDRLCSVIVSCLKKGDVMRKSYQQRSIHNKHALSTDED